VQAWQHGEDMKKRIVTNALCSWAEAVALSAGEDINLCRRACSEATIEVFQNIRQVSRHALLVLGLHNLPCQEVSSPTCDRMCAFAQGTSAMFVCSLSDNGALCKKGLVCFAAEVLIPSEEAPGR